MLVFIHHDRSNVCWRHCVNHELRRVIIPQDDIDTLAAQFGRNRLNARTAHTNTGADRINTLVVGLNGDFRTRSRITGSRFNFDNFFANFRYFNAEQLNQHFRFGTGYKQLRTARFRAYRVQNATNTVTWAEVFTREHVFTQDNSFSIAAQIQRNVVAVYFLYHTGDDFAFVFAELIDNHCAFSFTYFLYDNLFRGLGGDTVKGDRFNLIFNIFAHVQTFVFEACRFQRNFFGRLSNFFYDYPTTEGIEITAFTIDFYANVDLLLIFFLCCCSQRTFQCFKNFLAWQRFFVGYGFNNSQNFFVHRGLFTSIQTVKSGEPGSPSGYYSARTLHLCLRL